MGLLTSNEQGRLFSLITQFTRSTDTRRSSRAHRGVRGALVPGLVTESRADGLESRSARSSLVFFVMNFAAPSQISFSIAILREWLAKEQAS